MEGQSRSWGDIEGALGRHGWEPRDSVVGSVERQEMWGHVGVPVSDELPEVWKGKVDDGEEEHVVTTHVPFVVNFIKGFVEVQPSPVEDVVGDELRDFGEGQLDAAKFHSDRMEVIACEVGV